MHIAPVLTALDLPPEELQAAVLDGELTKVGTAYCAIDTIVATYHRAASIALEVPERAIAERRTAIWVYGIVLEAPRRLQLCVDARTKFRPLSSPRLEFREVVLENTELDSIGGLSITTPMRTALDFARFDGEFSDNSCTIVRALASFGAGFTLDSCISSLKERRNLPHRRRAILRLSAALGHGSRTQPAFTR